MLLNYVEPSFYLGPLTFHLYGLGLVAAILVGLALAHRRAIAKKIEPDLIFEFAIYAVVGAVVGSRILSVLLNFNLFLADPLYLFRIHEGGLAFLGGLTGGVLVAIWFVRRRKVKFWAMADVFAPSLALGEAIARLGCDVYGLHAPSAPWPRLVGGVPYHNIPLYTMIATLLIFFVLWYLRDRVREGQLFLTYLAGYFAARSFIDYFRSEPTFVVFNTAQFSSIVLFAVILVLIYWREKQMLPS
ncbi:MAG: prolipoprotein diacylglyceryl transferase [Clostridiales bacterium]|jgi:phosphatidylglycerol:prolipoprotein diacylglycerol transferase|nr:prolipoprotein diacylglyceryl transferase [Dethiobacter sp.]MBS4032536.1 prolipoprotein diacylglyceryl transferase [Clostridiales bacterium]